MPLAIALRSCDRPVPSKEGRHDVFHHQGQWEQPRCRCLQVGVAAGGGLMLSLRLPTTYASAQTSTDEVFKPNAFVRIERDGRIILTMPYVEMGQATYTSIPMLIAEELEVDLKQVELEHAPPDEKLYANPLLGVQAT